MCCNLMQHYAEKWSSSSFSLLPPPSSHKLPWSKFASAIRTIFPWCRHIEIIFFYFFLLLQISIRTQYSRRSLAGEWVDSIRTSADDVKAGASLATNIISRLAKVLVSTSDYNTQTAGVLKFSFGRCIK